MKNKVRIGEIALTAAKKIAVRLAVLMIGVVFAANAAAQTTAFTFQGKLNDGGAPASANYDMRFRLFDAAGAANPIGAPLTLTNVPIVAGIFTVQLDFGAEAFNGGERFVEIAVSPAGENNFVTLAPRQRLTSAPYSVQSRNATTAETSGNSLNLGGIAASQYVQTGDARLSDARVPLPGSNDYLQNNAGTPQPGVNFNIGGSGSANILNAQTQFNLGGSRILSSPGNANLFIGINSGANNAGIRNSFIGDGAGFSNTSGIDNSFIGTNAGRNNSIGSGNSFLGSFAGVLNTTGSNNSFFGASAGGANTSGSENSFFGLGAGNSNTTGSKNSFFGAFSGEKNTTGFFNSLFGDNAGASNTTGSQNTFIGKSAGLFNTEGGNNLFAGSSAGFANTTGNNNSFAGTGAGQSNTTGGSNSFFGVGTGSTNTTGSNNTFIGAFANATGNNLNFAAAIGARARVTSQDTIVIGKIAGLYDGVVRPPDAVQIPGSLSVTGRFSAGGAKLFGSATGNENLSYMSFAESSGVDLGYVGDGSNGDRNIFLASYFADVELITPAGRVLTATSTGRVIVPAGQGAGFNPALEIAPSQIGGSVIANNLYIRQFNEPGAPAHLCWRVSNAGVPALVVTSCTTSFSASQYKTDFEPFVGGLSIIRRLNPNVFKWKADGTTGVGLNAEELADVAPQLVTRNDRGEIEDVRENSLNAVFINAIKEQQKQIETQSAQIKQQQQQLEALIKIVCQSNPQADVCREEK